jgi:hypothetical protein
LSVEGFHVRVTAFWVVAAWRKPDGVAGGWVSPQAAVETVTPTRPDRFPAASKAVTPTMRLLPHARPPNVYAVLSTVALRSPFA